MQQRFEIHKAPVPPLRAEPRHAAKKAAAGHIQGVEATSGGLIRSTLGAAAAAGAILVFAWLPAEYGVDPTGVGRVLGPTQMGEIKQQLYAESSVDEAARSARMAALSVSGDPEMRLRLEAIETQLMAIAEVIGAAPTTNAAPGAQPPAPAAEAAAALAPAPAEPAAPAWRDEVSYTLDPGEGVEVKLVMTEGAVARFEWTANGAVLNHDTHGDGGGQNVTYERGRGVPGQQGELTAAFAGNHGWFWRNRSELPVTFTLRTGGDYSEMKAP